MDSTQKRVWRIDVSDAKLYEIQNYIQKIRYDIKNDSKQANIVIVDERFKELVIRVINCGKDSLNEQELQYYMDCFQSTKEF